MVKHVDPTKNIALVLFERSWGEVDWILPVLYKLKEVRDDFLIYAIFSPHWKQFNQTSNSLLTLEILLNQIVDNLHVFQSAEDKLPAIQNSEQVKIIFNDHGNDTQFRKNIHKQFDHAAIFTFPHGLTARFAQNINHPRNFNQWEKKILKHDLMLLDNSLEYSYFLRFISDANIAAIGSPRHDSWWIKKILSIGTFLQSKEYSLFQSGKKIFSFFLRPPTVELPLAVFDYVLKSVADTILNNEQNILLIKPHPRQNNKIIEKYLKIYNSDQYILTELHPLQISYISNFVINVFTTCTLDALRMGKPVVEFHQYIRPCIYFSTDQYSQFQSIFRLFNLAAPANTKDDLKNYINNYFNNSNDNNVWHEQQQSFQKLFPPENYASERAVDLILEVAREKFWGKKIRKKRTTLINNAHLPIDERNNFYYDSITNNFNFKICRIKAFGMPINSTLLKEFVRAFNSEILIMTGTFNEHFISESSKLFKEVYLIEAASDLYQTSSMKELKTCHNFRLFNSANQLKLLLKDINGRLLFWLSTHEASAITTVTKTNTPIIEELKAIKESNIKNSVILINNIRYFKPIVINEHEAQTIRKYPSLYDAFQIILEINSNYQFYVLGDIAIAYLPEFNITISPAVKACTISRLFDNNTFDINTVFDSENFITFNIESEEKETLKMMYEDYFSYEDFGTGGYYKLWRALILFGEAQYQEAKENFLKALQLGCKHWRVFWYLAKSAQLDGDIKIAKEAIQEVINVAPHFKPAISLYKQIGT